MWSLIVLIAGTLIVAWLASQITPAFVARYMAPILAGILLLAAWGAARSGVVGLVAIALCGRVRRSPVVIRPAVQERHARHRRRDHAAPAPGRPGGRTRSPTRRRSPGTTCPAGLQYATSLGPCEGPELHGLGRCADEAAERASRRRRSIRWLLASSPGSRLLYVRPLTEGAMNWKAPWTRLARRRAAQLGQILQDDVNSGVLKQIATAPHNYRGASILAYSAVLYQKAS